MSILNTNIQRKLGFFHSLSKTMVEANQNVFESIYKSSHNVRLNEVWSDNIGYAVNLTAALNEATINNAVTYHDMVTLTPIPGTNNQAYYFESGAEFVRPWIAPTDIPDLITNEPSYGYELRLFRENDTQIFPTFGNWDISYYAGIIHFEPGSTPIDLGFGNIKASFFAYTGGYGASGTTDVNVENIGVGEGIFRNVTGTTINLRSIIGSGDTTVTTSGDTIVVHSVGGSGTTNITAENGLTLSGNTIVLGGELTGDTYINSANSVFEINNLVEFWLKTDDAHHVYFSDQAGFVLTGNTFVFEDSSLVTKEYVDYIRTHEVTGTTYQATKDDDFIETSGGTIIILPENPVRVGKRIIVVDVEGDAELNPIIIFGGDNNILDGSNDNEALINTNFGSLSFIFNNKGFWSVIGFTN